MKTYLSKRFIIVILILAIGFSSGCTNKLPDEQPTALIIIAGNHANSNRCDISLYNKIENVYSLFGNIKVIVIDGNPTIVKDENGNPIGYCDEIFINKSKKQYQDNEEYWRNNYILPKASQVNNFINKVCSDDPEVDTLKSLQVAAKELNSFMTFMEPNTKKEIIICDTGLSTIGELSFLDTTNNKILGSQKKLWEDEEGRATVKNMIDKLNLALPELSGVTITWYGIGIVSGDQDELSILTMRNLQYIWGEILHASGAIGGSNDNIDNTYNQYGIFVDVNSGEPIVSNQKVTKVIFEQNIESPIDENHDGSSPPEPSDPPPPPSIAPDTFFVADKASFREDIDPYTLLQPWVNSIERYPSMSFVLVGSTADPNKNGGSTSLSKARANAVKNILVELGVDSNRLEVVGVGSKAPWYDENEWQNGKFITDSEAAKSNRTVRIFPFNSPTAQEILSLH